MQAKRERQSTDKHQLDPFFISYITCREGGCLIDCYSNFTTAEFPLILSSGEMDLKTVFQQQESAKLSKSRKVRVAWICVQNSCEQIILGCGFFSLLIQVPKSISVCFHRLCLKIRFRRSSSSFMRLGQNPILVIYMLSKFLSWFPVEEVWFISIVLCSVCVHYCTATLLSHSRDPALLVIEVSSM